MLNPRGLFKPSKDRRYFRHHFFEIIFFHRALLLLRLSALSFVMRLPVRPRAVVFSLRLQIFRNMCRRVHVIKQACLPAQRTAVDMTVAIGARCTTSSKIQKQTTDKNVSCVPFAPLLTFEGRSIAFLFRAKAAGVF